MAEKIWPPSSAFRGRVPDLDAENASLKARLAVFAAIIKDEQNKVAVLTDTIEVQREENASLRAEIADLKYIVRGCPQCRNYNIPPESGL